MLDPRNSPFFKRRRYEMIRNESLYFFCWCKYHQKNWTENFCINALRALMQFSVQFFWWYLHQQKKCKIHFLSFHIIFFWKTDCFLDPITIYSRTIFRKFGGLRSDITAFQDENKLWLPPWFKHQTIVSLYISNKNKLEQILHAQFIFE